MKLARALLVVGRVLITAGTLLLLFVAYQLWGTGFHTQRAQDNAEDEFEAALEASQGDLPAEPQANPPPRPRRQPVPHAPPHGEWVGRITIPAIDAANPIVAGCNWIDWIYVKRRDFENRQQVLSRFREILCRMKPPH